MKLVSPTDTPLAKLLGCRTSWVTEEYGADCIASTPLGLYAVQRKTVEDLLASIIDGRLGRELGLIQFLPFPVLMIEGVMEFTSDGYLMMARQSQWTRLALRNLFRSVWYFHHVSIEFTDNLQDTATVINETVEWLEKPAHRGLITRPSIDTKDWGKSTQRSFGIYYLQGLPGIGPVRAAGIYDALGLPFRWTCTPEELLAIPGLGKETVKDLVTVFDKEREGYGLARGKPNNQPAAPEGLGYD